MSKFRFLELWFSTYSFERSGKKFVYGLDAKVEMFADKCSSLTDKKVNAVIHNFIYL